MGIEFLLDKQKKQKDHMLFAMIIVMMIINFDFELSIYLRVSARLSIQQITTMNIQISNQKTKEKKLKKEHLFKERVFFFLFLIILCFKGRRNF